MALKHHFTCHRFSSLFAWLMCFFAYLPLSYANAKDEVLVRIPAGKYHKAYTFVAKDKAEYDYWMCCAGQMAVLDAWMAFADAGYKLNEPNHTNKYTAADFFKVNPRMVQTYLKTVPACPCKGVYWFDFTGKNTFYCTIETHIRFEESKRNPSDPDPSRIRINKKNTDEEKAGEKASDAPASGNASAGFLAFPIKDFTPYTCRITSVVDHNVKRGVMTTYTGESSKTQNPDDLYGVKIGENTYYEYTLKDDALDELNYRSIIWGWGRKSLSYDNHKGYDYPNPNTRQDCIVYAAAAGTVVCCYRKNDPAFGKHVVIEHEHNAKKYLTLYAHLDEIYDFVKEGLPIDNIGVGEGIGVMGDTGTSAGVHLHFGVYLYNGTVRHEYSWINGYTHVDPYGWKGEKGKDTLPGNPGDILWLQSLGK